MCRLFSGAMVYVCWAKTKHIPMIRFLKFVELTATNMLAVTNLAICVNLALIVSVSECRPTECGLDVHLLPQEC